VTGWVKSFKDQWGLLNSNRFDGDVFFGMKGNKQLQGMNLTQGAQVEFQIAPDDKGQRGLQALNVKLVGGGGLAAIAQMMASTNPLAAAGMMGMMGLRPENLVGARLEGVIRSFKEDWGFIISPSFQGDLFVHKGSNPNLMDFRAGDTVSFDISQSSNGKCQAINVQAGGGGATVMGGTGTNANRSSSLAGLEGQRVTGQVRSFDGNWGFGISDNFQGDIFIGTKSNPLMGPLNRGDTIEFTVQRSSSNKSQTGFEAVNVQVTESAPQDENGNNLMGSAAGGSGRSRSPRRQATTMAGVAITGWIRSFKGDWGFVNSDSFDGDLFVGLRSNPHLPGELSANDQVMFQISVGPAGKAEAIDVQVLSSAADAGIGVGNVGLQ